MIEASRNSFPEICPAATVGPPMPGLVPGTHVFLFTGRNRLKTWMAGTSPATGRFFGIGWPLNLQRVQKTGGDNAGGRGQIGQPAGYAGAVCVCSQGRAVDLPDRPRSLRFRERHTRGGGGPSRVSAVRQ